MKIRVAFSHHHFFFFQIKSNVKKLTLISIKQKLKGSEFFMYTLVVEDKVCLIMRNCCALRYFSSIFKFLAQLYKFFVRHKHSKLDFALSIESQDFFIFSSGYVRHKFSFERVRWVMLVIRNLKRYRLWISSMFRK